MPVVRVFDMEADGFLDKVTKIHCASFRDLEGNAVASFRPNQLKELVEYLDTVDVLIGHNILGYDLPVLNKILGYTFKGKKVDTLIMSRLLNPKRILPIHAVDRKAGPHSLYAWGVRVGVDKPDHEDWENFSEAMFHRCVEDTKINVKVYHELMKEAHGKNWKNAFLLSFRLFDYLYRQERYGWKVDREHMENCIRILDRKIQKIDKALDSRLPMVLEVLETKEKGGGEYKYLKKPFLKSGEYSKPIIQYCDEAGIDLHARTVGGVFTRITFRQLDLNSNDETKQYLLNLGWEPLEWNTNDAGERTSPKLSKDDPFEGITSGLGRLIALRVRAKQRKSIIEGLIGLIRPDGSISSIVNNLADTARATHRNIVNIPKVGSFFGKQMRKIFVAREGKVLVGTDSDSCQLRMLGARMKNHAYIEAIMTGDKAKGTDLHSLTRKIAELESRDIAKNVIYVNGSHISNGVK
ncbi:MAG: DNA polymerase [Podoviridae sp. ctbj_2]|nr:MAG: DNA polymerase [Podoviridae sp. ctbj_2]